MKKYTQPQICVIQFESEPFLENSPMTAHNTMGDENVEFVKKEGGTDASPTPSGGSLWDENW